MDTRQTIVTCPCCESRLEVDARSGKVVSWRRKQDVDETGKTVIRESDWDDASGRVAERLSTAEQGFEQGLAKEKNRGSDLDDLFKKASDKARRRPDDG